MQQDCVTFWSKKETNKNVGNVWGQRFVKMEKFSTDLQFFPPSAVGEGYFRQTPWKGEQIYMSLITVWK